MDFDAFVAKLLADEDTILLHEGIRVLAHGAPTAGQRPSAPLPCSA